MRKASPTLAARRKWVYYNRHFYFDTFRYESLHLEDFEDLFVRTPVEYGKVFPVIRSDGVEFVEVVA